MSGRPYAAIIRVDGKAVFSVKLVTDRSAVALRSLRTPDGRFATVQGGLYVLPQEIIAALSNSRDERDRNRLMVFDVKGPLKVRPIGWIDQLAWGWSDEKFGQFKRRLSQLAREYSKDVGADDRSTGGIDLNAVERDLRIRAEGEGIKFNIDPAMLKKMQDAPGVTPVILNVTPLVSLPEFLGIEENAPHQPAVLSAR
jgi:hypothetical protein